MPRFNAFVVWALAKRDLSLYFSNPTGYVFITLFIFLSAAAAFWQDRFFLQNLANLDQLNAVLPVLLVFFVPALTMSLWSDEKKLGTDELLLTLPATDLEVVVGKYLAALGIYSVSLVLALSYVLVLFNLGSPDLGLMGSNYLGYWCAGGALIAVGMLASLITANATIAFILGAIFCGAITLGPSLADVSRPEVARLVRILSLDTHFQDFSKGVISATAMFYFASVAGVFLYLNAVVLGRRHWAGRAGGVPMWVHSSVRGIALVAALASAGVLVARVNARYDATAERLHTLSDETRALVDQLPDDRPVFIQAYISPIVPEPFVQTRSNLVSLLEEIDVLAGTRVEVVIEDTEPFSAAAREARETFGIRPRGVTDVSSARAEVAQVFMGLAFTSGAEEQIIDFFDRGLPAEYEIMRGIRVVAGTDRRRVGVIKTMMDLAGGVNYQRNEFKPQWPVVAELRKQYVVYSVDPDFPINPDLDAILVPLPSSLQTDQLQNISDFIRAGKPALILVDPLPAIDPTLSPTEWVGDGNPYTYPPGTPRPGPRGNVRQWLMELGVRWEPTRVVWDSYNPHPDLAHLQSEFVFLGAGNGNAQTFATDNPMTAQLQELMLPFVGHLEPVEDQGYQFEPLLRAGYASGSNGYFSLVRASPTGPQLNPTPPRNQEDRDYVLAAHVRGVPTVTPGLDDEGAENPPSANGSGVAETPPGAADDVGSDTASAVSDELTETPSASAPEEAEARETQAASAGDEASDTPVGRLDDEGAETPPMAEPADLAPMTPVNMIVVADLDFIGDQFFAIRQQAPGGLSFDNVTFFLNALDTLVGEDSFIELRSRRARHRTLERLEAQTAGFLDQRTRDERQAEQEAEAALTEAQARLNERVAALQNRGDIDSQTMQIMVRNLEEVESRRLEVLSTNIETEKQIKIQASRETMVSQLRRIQTTIRMFAILLPPIPVLLGGVAVLARRRRRERAGAAEARRLRQ